MSKKTGFKLRQLGRLTMALPLLVSLGACEMMRPMKPGPDAPPPVDQSDSVDHGKPGRFLPYSIRFDKDGKPLIVDEKGKVIPGAVVKTPLRATAVESIQSMGSVIYKGSCKQVFSIGGRLIEVDLPPQYCTQ